MSLVSAFRPRSARNSSPQRTSRLRNRKSKKQHESSEAEDPEGDAHSIITPSKHTPRPLRALRGSVAAGGLLWPFRLLKRDIINLRRRYGSDWTIFNQLIFASAVYVFFTNLLPGITFASDLYVLTGKSWGTIEVVFSTGLCGVIFSLYAPLTMFSSFLMRLARPNTLLSTDHPRFSIQPLTIVGVTGPFSVLAENIYNLCNENFKIPFLPFMAWSLIHSAWLHYVLAIINAHDWTMRYVTTFATEIFSLLNSIIYFHKAIQELERTHENLSFAAFLYAVIGAVGTMLFAIFLSTAESWRPLFHRYVRLLLTEYAAAISIVVFIALPHAGELANLDKMTLPVSLTFKPTSPDRETFIVEFWKLPVAWVFAAIIPGIIITILFFFDHEVSSIICTIDRYGTRKPGGFAWDIILLGTTTALCGILGIPPSNGLLPQAPLHSESLMHTEKEDYTITVNGEEKIQTREVKRVYEQRWSSFLHAGAIFVFVSPPLMRVLGLTPTSVLAGLFLFMGEQSLSVNPILYRTFYLLTPPSELPSLPPALTKKKDQTDLSTDSAGTNESADEDIQSRNKPSYIPIHIYTILQIVITVGIFIVTLTQAAPAFPVIIIALVPFRLLLMKKWWPREVLRFVDAWACKEGTPEDDEDANARTVEPVIEETTGHVKGHNQSGEGSGIFAGPSEDVRNATSTPDPSPKPHRTSKGHEVRAAGNDDEWVELDPYPRVDEEMGNKHP